MGQAKKVGARKRTFLFSDELILNVKRIAESEHRTITAQIEVFLWEKTRQYAKNAFREEVISDDRTAL